MYRLEREEFVKSPYLLLWSLLGFQAGYVNAFGFLACGRYVSHLTGFGTQIGVALANNSLFFSLELLGFPFFFILGSFLSGFITAARIERGLKPRFDIAMASVPTLILLLWIVGFYGWFGAFGEELIRTRDFILLFLLSFVCGVQNGCFSVLTKGQIRTTHLTGISTDIGTDLARIWFGRLPSKELELTARVNFSRFATFISFSIGSVASVLASNKLLYHSLVVPLITSIIVFASVKVIGKFLDLKFSVK
jgi:uncharacterized membrane protein YoaK (UPF0700 family)